MSIAVHRSGIKINNALICHGMGAGVEALQVFEYALQSSTDASWPGAVVMTEPSVSASRTRSLAAINSWRCSSTLNHWLAETARVPTVHRNGRPSSFGVTDESRSPSSISWCEGRS